MINIILIDDESGQLEIMKNIISELHPNFHVICFDNPKKALAYISANAVDAVITDIKMPGMNGIELSREISQLNKDILVAIISAYSDFEYAQKGISYGVIDYLIKPISHSKIVELLDKINQKISIKTANKQRLEILNSQLESYKPLYIEKQLKSWLNGTVSPSELNSIRSLFKYNGSGIVVASQIGNFENNPSHIFWREDLIPFLKMHIHRLFSSNQTVLNVVYDDEKLILVSVIVGEKDLSLDSVFESFSALSLLVNNEYHVNIYSGASEIVLPIIDNVYEYLNQALSALDYTFLNPSSSFFAHEYLQNVKSIDDTILYSFQSKVLDKFYLYNTDGIQEILESFCITYSNNGFLFPTNILKQYFINIVFLAKKHVQYELQDNIIEDIKNCHSINILTSVVKNYLECLIIFQQKKVDEATQQVIDKMRVYIDSHYTENISLELIAEQMHFNPNYIGHLFKQQNGLGFKEYIIKIRIDKAKQLLSETNLKIYEIAKKIGYNDVAYFIKIFKKETGISPKKFRIG